MSRFAATPTPLVGLQVLTRQQLGDDRGFLSRLFCDDELQPLGWRGPVAQVNHTHTRLRGTVRGMHYQLPPHAEIKLVTCLRGEVWDVAVDLRPESLTFLQWHAELLSAGNARALLIPQGFAHGFQTQSDDVDMLYCHSAAYAGASEAGLNPRDNRLAIAWPLPLQGLSARDAAHPLLTPQFEGVRL